MNHFIKSFKERKNWLLSKTGFQKHIYSGSISYDYWNEIHENFKRKLNVCKHNFEKDGSDDFGDVDQFISKISEDSRQNGHPSHLIYFNQKKARIIYNGEVPIDSFMFYNIKELTTKMYKLKDGKSEESNSSMNFRVNPSWNVTYKVVKKTDDFKEILGFECIKYEIEQIKEIDGDVSKTIYELYATDKIKLPAHLICGWYDYVLKECPLEIKIYQPASPEIVNYLKVRDISNQLPKSIFKVPSKFKS